ncbi:MAG: asparaginase domain-containing protein [Treponema sp.]|nr:asparaginase domain-containing protein [Treponema sp.]
MYQSRVYLEVRVLLSAVPGVFIAVELNNGKKGILNAKADFLRRNNSPVQLEKVDVQPSALHKVALFVNAVGGTMLKSSSLEHLTGALPEPPDDKNFTGYSVCVAKGGRLDIMYHQKQKTINIEEIRIEEDRGKLTRSAGKKARMDWTFAGCPVMRIRTSSAFELGGEAEIFLHELNTLLAYLRLTAGDVQDSGVRCNAYVSLCEYPEEPLYSVKLRNLNSFNFVRKAIDSELSRQEFILSSGGSVSAESRLWNEQLNATEFWQKRSSDAVHFAKVNPALEVGISDAIAFESVEVELPEKRRSRFRSSYGLSRLRTIFLCAEKDRADYFESAVEHGAPAMLAAHWIASEVMKILNRTGKSIKQCKLSAEKFARVLVLLNEGKIHSGMAKEIMQVVAADGSDVDDVIEKQGMMLLSTKEELEPVIDSVLSEYPESVSSLKEGNMAPLEFLTGCVMKKTGGKAVPTVVKSMLKEKLSISIVYVLTMGGSITAEKQDDGTVIAGSAECIKPLLDEGNESFPVQVVSVCDMLSEETEPKDWAKLIAVIKEKMESGTANGIVVTHGTDTLAYTASLLFWLFSAAEVPVVLTASSSISAVGKSDSAAEARTNLNLAIKAARERKNGVCVVYGNKILPALNLKYVSNNSSGFINWNMKKPVFDFHTVLSQQFLSVSLPETEIMSSILNEAAERLMVIRLYPGLLMNRLEKMINDESSIDTVILELYSSGTGNMKNSDYSLKTFLTKGRQHGITFCCTSQQESFVDFSEYATSARLWQAGAVPFGNLTTESVTTLYFAASLIADNHKELDEIMESAIELL